MLGSLVLLTPALASLLVTTVAWKVSPGRRAEWWWAPGVLIALISVAFALGEYLDHAGDVTGRRALVGAAIAAVGSAVPLSVYYAVGRLVRDGLVVAVTWIASLMLLYPYSFIVLVSVLSRTQCPADNPGCLFG